MRSQCGCNANAMLMQCDRYAIREDKIREEK